MAERYGVVGREEDLRQDSYMGIIRSAFLVDENGAVEEAWYQIPPQGHPDGCWAR